jgi:hypothetical protein
MEMSAATKTMASKTANRLCAGTMTLSSSPCGSSDGLRLMGIDHSDR